MSVYNNRKGSRESIISVDGEVIRSEIGKVQIQVNKTASSYSGESKTRNYHRNLFEAIENTKTFWESFSRSANSFINNFESFPLPDDIYDDFDK